MCFSYSVNFNAEAMKSRLQLEEIVLPASGFFFSAFTYPLLPTIIASGEKNICIYKQWGLIPQWAKDEAQAHELRKLSLNAKGETVAEKPMFRNAFKNGRCLIPAAGFYEWREVNKKKYPYYIYPKTEAFFLFAGISENWTNRETGEELQTFSIVTSEANELLSIIHNLKKRMPFILAPEDADTWLRGTAEDALKLVKPFADAEMQAHTIGAMVSNPRNDRNIPLVQEKFVYAELEQNLLF